MHRRADPQGSSPEDRKSLEPVWSDGIVLAESQGKAGTDEWLRTLKIRNKGRYLAIEAAIKGSASRRSLKEDEDAIAGQLGEPWQEPMLGGMPPAVPFPVDVFPPQLAELAVEMAEALNSPVDFVAVSILFTASTAMGRSVALKMKKTWKENPSAYFALVGVSGMAKSTPIKEMGRPLWDIAREAREEWQANKEREEQKEKDNQQEVPPLKRTVVDESTVEALGPIMEENPRGDWPDPRRVDGGSCPG